MPTSDIASTAASHCPNRSRSRNHTTAVMSGMVTKWVT